MTARMRYLPISTSRTRRLTVAAMASVVLTTLVGAIWQEPAFAVRQPDGTFISVGGATYRVAGGAPILVTTCAPFPAQCTIPTAVPDLSEYNQFPADGTFIRGAQTGQIYRVAGGAPIYVTNCGLLGGCPGAIDVDQTAIDNAGGGGGFNHLRAVPLNGTILRAVGSPTGELYVIAGGAPVYISDCAPFAGCPNIVNVDAAAINNAGSGGPYNHLRYFPADGTFLRGAQTGQIYRVAGGAPLYVTTCVPLAGCPGAVNVDQAAIDNASNGELKYSHLRFFPADGTFIRGAQTGEIYRIAGGAPIRVTDCVPLGGCPGFVDVDQAAITNAGTGGPYNHLRRVPAEGTVLQGLPSGAFWRIVNACRQPVAGPQPAAIAVNDVSAVALPLCGALGAESDYDGDRKSDVGVYRPSSGVWYINRSGGGTTILQWGGVAGDVPTSGDFDGDGITDIAIFRPSTGIWYINRSSGGTTILNWGQAGDIPIPGDYDGDGRDDIAVFRPSTGIWYVNRSGGGTTIVNWGAEGDLPVTGDFDGDGKDDIAVFRPSTGIWYINRSSGGITVVNWGGPGDIPKPADYDGDGRDDIAVFRPSTGVWYINRSSGGTTVVNWGVNGDIPTAGDYDGDGRDDIAVFRPSTGVWYINRSSGGTTVINWGINGDIPTGPPPLGLPAPAA